MTDSVEKPSLPSTVLNDPGGGRADEKRWEDSTDSLIGQTIGNVRIAGVLGRGGMGAVYRGFDEKLERDLAIKVIREQDRLNTVARARFLQEARILSKLRHPNICQIYDYVEEEEQDFLLLELIEGKSLREISSNEVDEHHAKRLAAQLLDALAAAHAKGIVHRDMKPGNVMVTAEGDIKVLDFGLARWERSDRQEHELSESSLELDEDGLPIVTESRAERSRLDATRQGAVIGTLRYMSPEQARGEPVGPASDIFSVGLVLQEVFTGSPAQEKGIKFGQLLTRAVRGETQPVLGLDPDLTALIESLKSIAPGERPSARDARQRLAWIEAAPRRRLRRRLTIGAITGLSILVAALALLAIQVSRERTEAQKARGQAEELVTFMLEDLYEGLEPLGRTDLLREVAEKTQSYFEQLSPGRRQETKGGAALALRNVGLVLRGRKAPCPRPWRPSSAHWPSIAIWLQQILRTQSGKTASPAHTVISARFAPSRETCRRRWNPCNEHWPFAST